jgi:outer membrane protein assembly factor BamB/uncharacterized protein YycO
MLLNPLSYVILNQDQKILFKNYNNNEEIKSSSVSTYWSYTTGNWVYSSPAIGDVDSDGKLEVIIGSHDKNIYALNGEDGSKRWSYTTGGAVFSSPALGDIDGDGKLEVVVGSRDHKIYALNGEDGTKCWSYTTGDEIFSSPALGDVDGDGKLEIIIGSGDFKIYALNGEDGSKLWSYTTYYCIESSPALGDIDGDGKLEVIIGSYDYDYKIYALNGEDGSKLWSYTTGNWVYSSPSLGDLDADGKLEIVIGSRDNNLYALNGENGKKIWSYTTGDHVESTPALGDVDGDGKLEVIIGSNDKKIYAINGEDGKKLWSYTTGDYLTSSPAIGDIDGDGKPEVIVGSYDGNVYAINGEYGTKVWSYMTGEIWYSSPALGDLDDDGNLEVIIGSSNKKIYALSPSPSGKKVYWQGFSGESDFYRRKNYKYIQDFPSKPPETEIVGGPSGSIDYNNITFTWIGSDDITPSSKLIYSYKLEGYEASWSFWLSKTSKEYNNLPNGGYTFKVRAKDKDGNIEQTPAERTFTIKVPLIWGIDEYLVRLIDRYAPSYYNDFWDVSISEYKSWIALITLREAGFGRYAAHSQTGRTVYKGTVYCDRFNHKDIGYKFPFSTGIGAFQLDRGGSQGDANEDWGILPTIKKLNPLISLLSVLRWHQDRFSWDKANLADFSLNSAWNAVKPSKESGFSANWKEITGYDWDKCKTRKIDVNFTPPIVDNPYSNNVKFIGKIYWDVNNFVGYYNTWLISSRSWSGDRVTQYYYTYREDLGYEIWVYNDPENKYIYRFDRNYAAGQDPESTKDMGTYFIAGATSNKPSLDPNNILIFPRDGDLQTGDILLKNNGDILDIALEWTHLGIYVGNNEVIEVKSGTIVYNDLSEWDDEKNVALLRVISAREDQRYSAAKWAEKQVGKINSYLWSEKKMDSDSLAWYGSELVWAAYKNQGIDIDFDQSEKFVSPDDIYKDSDTMEISGSAKDLPLLKDYISIKSRASVDLSIVDPQGSKVSKEISQITDAYYLEGDIDWNGDMEALVLLPKREIGDYVISITPKVNAQPTDIYSLEVSTEAETLVLAQNELIKNIPYSPYTIRSDLSGISYENSQENLPAFQIYISIITLILILGFVSLLILFREKILKKR